MKPAEPPVARRWKNAVERERDGSRSRRHGVFVLLLALASVPVTVYLLEQMEHARLRYEIQQARVRLERLTEDVRRLRVAREELRALARIERHASGLGLVPTEQRRVLAVHRRSGDEGLVAREERRTGVGSWSR